MYTLASILTVQNLVFGLPLPVLSYLLQFPRLSLALWRLATPILFLVANQIWWPQSTSFKSYSLVFPYSFDHHISFSSQDNHFDSFSLSFP
jgi:hypothetical protein